MMALAQRLRAKQGGASGSSKIINAADLARAARHPHEMDEGGASAATPQSVVVQSDAGAGKSSSISVKDRSRPASAEEMGSVDARGHGRKSGDKSKLKERREEHKSSSHDQQELQRRMKAERHEKAKAEALERRQREMQERQHRVRSERHEQRSRPDGQDHHQHQQHHQQQHARMEGRPHAKTTSDMPANAQAPLTHQHSLTPQHRPRQYSHASALGTPPPARSASGSVASAFGGDRSTIMSNTSSKSGRSNESDRPEQAVDVLFHGYLAQRRGILKVTEKRYYFLAKRTPDLYSCKDEASFNLWHASGHALDDSDPFARANGLAPVMVCTVLRADPATGDGGPANDRSISVVAGSASKCTTLRFTAENPQRSSLWITALREVQVTQVHPGEGEAKVPSASDKKLLLPLNAQQQLKGSPHYHDAMERSGASNENASNAGNVPIRPPSVSSSSSGSSSSKGPRAYTAGKLQSQAEAFSRHRRGEDDDPATPIATPSSSGGSGVEDTLQYTDAPSLASVIPSRSHRVESNASFLSTVSASSQASANVVLFVPAAGSNISVSDTKLAKAKKELEALVASGKAKRPSRGGHDTDKNVKWRFGLPEYALSDLEYAKGKLREHESTPLESYVEECCQTFLMEATHKARFQEWQSVRHDQFYLQVNDGGAIAGSAIEDTDMFGMLYMTGFDLAELDERDGVSNEDRDPRAVLTEAFTEGFPMEVLEVFTQPPQCYFSWRHWGPFTGRYNGVKGDGTSIEVRGFGQMSIDSNRMLNLRLFFKQKELFVKLQQESQRIATTRGTAHSIGDGRTARSMSTASTSTPPPPPPPPANPPAAVPMPSPSVGLRKTPPRLDLKKHDLLAGIGDFT